MCEHNGAGSVAAGQSVSLVLTFDITQNTFQTVLQAAVLITTSGRPAAKVLSVSTFVLFMLFDSAMFVGQQQALPWLCCIYALDYRCDLK